jgi:hypothetical protein
MTAPKLLFVSVSSRTFVPGCAVLGCLAMNMR